MTDKFVLKIAFGRHPVRKLMVRCHPIFSWKSDDLFSYRPEKRRFFI